MSDSELDGDWKRTKLRQITRENRGETLTYRHKLGCYVEVHSDSIKSLSSGVYLNDVIVQFYTAYLHSEICSDRDFHRIHVFDPIFYQLIEETFNPEKKDEVKGGDDKKKKRDDARNNCDDKKPEEIDRTKWKQLNKWFNGIDIFQKDFLIFPICREDHWIAIVVCNPSMVPAIEITDRIPDTLAKKFHQMPVDQKKYPGIIVLDSLALNKKKVTNTVREFLDFEWRSRGSSIKDFSHHSVGQYHPPLQKQTNAYDCGIFMLAYLRSFMREPDNFYRRVRICGSDLSENLRNSVNRSLSESSRESIKSLIPQVCRKRTR